VKTVASEVFVGFARPGVRAGLRYFLLTVPAWAIVDFTTTFAIAKPAA